MALSVGDIVALSICAVIIFVVLVVIILGALMRASRTKTPSKKKRSYGATPATTDDEDDLTDNVLLDHFLVMLRQDGISLRLMKLVPQDNSTSEIIEVRLHLLGDQELSWLTGSLNLLEVVDILNGKPPPPSGSHNDPLEDIDPAVCFQVATANRRLTLITNSTLERTALKQGFEMLIRKLRKNRPPIGRLEPSASVSSLEEGEDPEAGGEAESIDPLLSS